MEKSITEEISTNSNCERAGCCDTTDDGSAICTVSQAKPINLNEFRTRSSSLWYRVRGSTMLGIACLTSPCCTLLILPLGLTLMAGTPVALWIGNHLGWFYGLLTLLSVVSFWLGLRWLGQSKSTPLNTRSARPFDIPFMVSSLGDKTDAEPTKSSI